MKTQLIIKLLTILYFMLVVRITPDTFKKCAFDINRGHETNVSKKQRLQEFYNKLKQTNKRFFTSSDIFFFNGFPRKSFILRKINKKWYDMHSTSFYNYILKKHTSETITFNFNDNSATLTKEYNSMLSYFGENFKNAFLTYIFDNDVLGVNVSNYTNDYISDDNLKSICNILEIKASTLNMPDNSEKGIFGIECEISKLKNFLDQCTSEWCKIKEIASLNEHLTKYSEKKKIESECMDGGECETGRRKTNSLSSDTYIGSLFNFLKFIWALFYYPDCLKLTVFFLCVSTRFSLNKLFFYFAPIPIVSVAFFYELGVTMHIFGLFITVFSLRAYFNKRNSK